MYSKKHFCLIKTNKLMLLKFQNKTNVGRQRCHPCGQNFSLGCSKCTLKSMHFQGLREVASLPQWKEGGPLLYPPPHNTVLCERHSAPFVLTCFLLPTSFLFYLKFSGEPCICRLDADFSSD